MAFDQLFKAGASLGVDPVIVARFIFSTPSGIARSIVGVTSESLRRSLDEAPYEDCGKVAVTIPVEYYSPAETVIENTVEALSWMALRMWPSWHGHRDVTRRSYDCSAASELWLRRAGERASRGLEPRPRGFAREFELTQLCLAIHPPGVVLVFTPARVPASHEIGPFWHALEWMAHHASLAIVLSLVDAPDHESAFDRALSSTLRISETRRTSVPAELELEDLAQLAPIRGEPHPLSEVERRVERALRADTELASLFSFNRIVHTTRGTTPKVDIIWEQGRVIVELDGYADHGGREAFMRDRHRDYELTLTGYTVLRIANDEVLQDVEKAIEKIRDIVRVRSTASMTGARK